MLSRLSFEGSYEAFGLFRVECEVGKDETLFYTILVVYYA